MRCDSKITQRLSTLFSVVLFCSLFSGCTKEDLSDCGGFDVAYRQTINKDGIDRFGTDVNRVNLFVFDDKGLFVGEFKDEGEHLNSNYKMPLKLKDGVYDMYVWGNLNDKYTTKPLTVGVSTYKDALLSVNRDASNLVGDLSNSAIYHGKAQKVEVKSNKYTRQVIDMMKDCNHIRVVIKGLPNTNITTKATAGELTSRIFSSNGDYNYDNTVAGNQQITYIPKYANDNDGAIVADFTTLRLIEGDASRITVNFNQAGASDIKELYNRNLTELLLEHPDINSQEDLDRLTEYTITIVIDELTMAVTTVTVNGWSSVDNDGNIH